MLTRQMECVSHAIEFCVRRRVLYNLYAMKVSKNVRIHLLHALKSCLFQT
jgi:hypothetical protein